MDDAAEKVVKKLILTRQKAGSILDVDPNASLRHIKVAFKKTSYKIYPKDIDTNKEDLLMFELVSAAYKRLASGTSDEVYIEADYPFKLFRKAFKEKRVVTITAKNGTFIVLGDKNEDEKSSSEDEFDCSQYSFVKKHGNRFVQNKTMSKAEKNRLKKMKQKENKRHAKEDLKKQRNELKEEKLETLNTNLEKVSNPVVSLDRQKGMLENVAEDGLAIVHASHNFEKARSIKSVGDHNNEKQDKQLEIPKKSDGKQHQPIIHKRNNNSPKALSADVQHDKQEEQPQMSQQSQGADNIHHLDKGSSNDCELNVSPQEREVQQKISKLCEEVDNHPVNPRLNNHGHKVLPYPQNSQMNNSGQYGDAGKRLHGDTPKEKVARNGAGCKMEPNIAMSHNKLMEKNSKTISSQKSSPDHVCAVDTTKLNDGKPTHAKPVIDECHSTSKKDYAPHKISKARSKSQSAHDVDMHVTPVHQSTTASKRCQNEYISQKNCDNSEQSASHKASNIGHSSCASDKTLQILLLHANEDVGRGNYIGAIASFTAAIDLDSSSCLLHINRSYCYEKLNDLEKALLDADCAIKISPKLSNGHLRKARVLAKMKRYSEAEKVYEYVLVLDKLNEIAKNELHEVRVDFLVCMGYSRQKSTLAVGKYLNMSSALENLLAGNFTDLVTDDVYVSDDEEIENTQTNGFANGIQKLHYYQNQVADTFGDLTSKIVHQCGENQISSYVMADGNVRTADSASEMLEEVEHYSVWLGNVTRKMKVDMLCRYFSKFGPIRNVKMHYERKYAFVNFENPESAPLAARGKGYAEIDGMKIRVSLGPGCKRS